MATVRRRIFRKRPKRVNVAERNTVVRVRNYRQQRGSSPGNLDLVWTGASTGTKVYNFTVVAEDFSGIPRGRDRIIILQSELGLRYRISGRTGRLKVRCECEDFYYRHAYDLQRFQSLYGNHVPPPKETVNRMRFPSLCKHLIAVIPSINRYNLMGRQTTDVDTTRTPNSVNKIKKLVTDNTKKQLKQASSGLFDILTR